MEKPEEQQSIEDVQKHLSLFSDDDLQQRHDDIAEDTLRFIEHVGIEKGTAFLIAMVSEMSERGLAIDKQFPQSSGFAKPEKDQISTAAQLQQQPHNALGGNRAQRRANKSKKGSTIFKKHGARSGKRRQGKA